MTKSVTLALLLAGTPFLLPCLGAAPAAAAQGLPAATAPPTEVDYFRGDLGHTGVSSEKLSAPLSLLWRHTAVAAPDNAASAVYSGSTVYFASGSVVSALNAPSGALKWRYPAEGKSASLFGATPALSGGGLYVPDDDGGMTKLDAATGKQLWKVKLEGAIRSAPVVSGGLVFFGTGGSHCYALSADTGQTVWDVPLGGVVTTSPAVTGGLVAFACSDNSVYSLNARTGRQAWSAPLDSDPSIVPLVFDGSLLYVTAGSSVYRLDPASGRQRTTISLPTAVLIPPTVSAGTTYIVSQANTLYALGAGGRTLWKTDVGSAVTAPPLLAGLLVVASQNGTLSGYDPATGRLAWQYGEQGSATDSQPKPKTANVFAAPVAADGTLFVVSDDGTLSAFRPDAPDSAPPQITQLSPAADADVSGTGLTYGALVVDLGSGIEPSSVSLQLDGKPDGDAHFHPEDDAIYDEPITPLAEGDHEIVVTASDWRGNKTSQNWKFTVRNGGQRGRGGFNPFGRGYRGGGQNPNAPPPPPPITGF